jgi:glyoxylase-like metal-dependent hydrolase (beta-lactamase superfamily II)
MQAKGAGQSRDVRDAHRMQVTPLFDGTAILPARTFPGRAAAGDETFDLPIWAFLILQPGMAALVDIGSAGNFGPATGRFMDSFAATGVSPAGISVIFLTHLHSDHYGNLVDAAGEARFPRARIVLMAAELDRAMDEAGLATLSDGDQKATLRTRAALAPYAGRITGVAADHVLLPGLRVLALPGHTIGHSGVQMPDGAVIAGDTFHNAAWQAADPSLHVIHDDDGPQAAQSRRRLLTRLAATGGALYGAHLPRGGPYAVSVTAQGFAVTPAA